MKIALLTLVVAGSVAACATDSETVEEYQASATTPLADIKAWVDIDLDELRLESGLLGCPRIDPGLQVTMDGETATLLDVGGDVRVDNSEPGHKVTNCTNPRFRMPRTVVDAFSTIVIADESATWTVVVDHPGIARTLHVVAPADSYVPGDTISVGLDTPGTYLDASSMVAKKDGAKLFEVYGQSEPTGAELRFRLPAVAEITDATEVSLSVRHAVMPATPICNGPLKCLPQSVSATLAVTATLTP